MALNAIHGGHRIAMKAASISMRCHVDVMDIWLRHTIEYSAMKILAFIDFLAPLIRDCFCLKLEGATMRFSFKLGTLASTGRKHATL